MTATWFLQHEHPKSSSPTHVLAKPIPVRRPPRGSCVAAPARRTPPRLLRRRSVKAWWSVACEWWAVVAGVPTGDFVFCRGAEGPGSRCDQFRGAIAAATRTATTTESPAQTLSLSVSRPRAGFGSGGGPPPLVQPGRGSPLGMARKWSVANEWMRWLDDVPAAALAGDTGPPPHTKVPLEWALTPGGVSGSICWRGWCVMAVRHAARWKPRFPYRLLLAGGMTTASVSKRAVVRAVTVTVLDAPVPGQAAHSVFRGFL